MICGSLEGVKTTAPRPGTAKRHIQIFREDEQEKQTLANIEMSISFALQASFEVGKK